MNLEIGITSIGAPIRPEEAEILTRAINNCLQEHIPGASAATRKPSIGQLAVIDFDTVFVIVKGVGIAMTHAIFKEILQRLCGLWFGKRKETIKISVGMSTAEISSSSSKKELENVIAALWKAEKAGKK